MNKLKNFKVTGTEFIICLIYCYIIMLLPHIAFYRILHDKNEYIKQLEQNQTEQAEEKEVYRNRCKMLEDLLEGSGLVVDDCECR